MVDGILSGSGFLGSNMPAMKREGLGFFVLQMGMEVEKKGLEIKGMTIWHHPQ